MVSLNSTGFTLHNLAACHSNLGIFRVQIRGWTSHYFPRIFYDLFLPSALQKVYIICIQSREISSEFIRIDATNEWSYGRFPDHFLLQDSTRTQVLTGEYKRLEHFIHQCFSLIYSQYPTYHLLVEATTGSSSLLGVRETVPTGRVAHTPCSSLCVAVTPDLSCARLPILFLLFRQIEANLFPLFRLEHAFFQPYNTMTLCPIKVFPCSR